MNQSGQRWKWQSDWDWIQERDKSDGWWMDDDMRNFDFEGYEKYIWLIKHGIKEKLS